MRRPSRWARFLLVAIAAMLSAGAQPGGAEEEVDAALVLAVDVSASIDEDEFQLQRQGYAAAFRDERVLDAIHQGRHGRIAVTLMHWASASEQRQVIEWTGIAESGEALGFAERLAQAPRTLFAGGSTSLSGAITESVRLLHQRPFGKARLLIDISGDGSNNNGRPPELAREEALAAGITINGLAIQGDEPLIERYFETHVIGGAGAFVVTVASSSGIAEALVLKLVREIAGEAAPCLEGPRRPHAPCGA